ncbi:BUB3-interacting and GLEBS motif-containing protein ZNF207-like isoform X2 [Centruroides vittatus]|uniref:BUB3-interacting and GLEBS motif-containing protein ZNF207-like isoform X2 n=1 Tax=Centruroides vittatus TaxID=120091 RepID=UPI00350EFB40
MKFILYYIRYCNREFDDEKILIQHQKAKHFKCHICHKKLYTGPGLAIHCMQVHKETLDKVPNALPNRNNIDIEIYGMEGIPEEDIKEHERLKAGGAQDSDRDDPKSDDNSNPGPITSVSSAMPPVTVAPGMMGPMPGMMGPVHGIPFGPGMHGPPMGPMPPMGMGPMGPMPPMDNQSSAMNKGMAPHFMGPGGMPPGSMPVMGPMVHPHVPPVSVVPPVSQAIPASVAAAAATVSQPAKPLFPAAAGQAVTTTSSTPVGADFKPLSSSPNVKPTFPAYSGTNTTASSSESTVTTSSTKTGPSTSSDTKKPATINTSGATSKIIHPEEDISLEERRARMPKYQMMNAAAGNVSQPPTSAVMTGPGKNCSYGTRSGSTRSSNDEWYEYDETTYGYATRNATCNISARNTRSISRSRSWSNAFSSSGSFTSSSNDGTRWS